MTALEMAPAAAVRRARAPPRGVAVDSVRTPISLTAAVARRPPRPRHADVLSSDRTLRDSPQGS